MNTLIESMPAAVRRYLFSIEAVRQIVEMTPVGERKALPARAIHRRVACYSQITVRHVLRELARAGIIQRRVDDCGNIQVGYYWRDEPITNPPTTVAGSTSVVSFTP